VRVRFLDREEIGGADGDERLQDDLSGEILERSVVVGIQRISNGYLTMVVECQVQEAIRQ
jgi:hypothetical protein